MIWMGVERLNMVKLSCVLLRDLNLNHQRYGEILDMTVNSYGRLLTCSIGDHELAHWTLNIAHMGMAQISRPELDVGHFSS